MGHQIEVGDVFVYTWGYDQTNVQFFQVLKVSEKTVVVREIETEAVTEEGFMNDRCVARRDKFKNEEPLRKLVQADGSLRFDYGTARRWDGRPQDRSWYA